MIKHRYQLLTCGPSECQCLGCGTVRPASFAGLTCATCHPKSTNDILEERGKTHGDFAENGRIIQRLKDTVRDSHNWHPSRLTPAQREAIDMILHKIGRIVNGNPNEPDHWKDIVGYATLVERELSKAED